MDIAFVLYTVLVLFCHFVSFVSFCHVVSSWSDTCLTFLDTFTPFILRSQEANALECHAMPVRAVPKTPLRFESKASCASVGTRPCEYV